MGGVSSAGSGWGEGGGRERWINGHARPLVVDQS